MANKKRIIALFAATALFIATVPTVSSVATGAADEEIVDASAEGEGEEQEQEQEESGTILDNGEIAMDDATGKVDKKDWITIKDYEKVAEDDTYEMYYYETRMSVILKNKKTGKLIESTLSDELDDGLANRVKNNEMKSGIWISAINGTGTSRYDMNMLSDQDIQKSKKAITNGVAETIYFPQYGVGMTVEMTLENGQFMVRVPQDSLVEDKEDFYINTVTLFPFMGYTFMDDQNGYMLIPDGNGALIYLDNKSGRFKTGYTQDVYGMDLGLAKDESAEESDVLLWDKFDIVNAADPVIAPIFGMAHLDDKEAYLAIIEDGVTRSSVWAEPNGVTVNYNRCYAKFLVRDQYLNPLNETKYIKSAEPQRLNTDMSICYYLLNGEDADYVGMANTYRKYLQDNDLVPDDADTSYKTRVDFLGTDRESSMLSTSPITMTTTKNIEEMYEQLQADGVESVLTVYKGWQKGGVYNWPVSSYKADGKIGGTRELTKLIEESAEKDYDVYVYNNALLINASTNTMTFDATKRINKKTLTIDTHQQVYDTFYYQLPEKSKTKLEDFAEDCVDDGVKNIALAGITDNLFSYSSKGDFYSRQDSLDDYMEAIETIGDDTNLIMETPAAYMWKHTKAFLDMPLGSSNYMFVNEEVPFLSMVLKGILPMYSDYVNFEANKQEFFLQMVESGVYPSFYLTYENSSKLIYTNSSDLYSTEFSVYKDTVVEYNQKLKELAEKTGDATVSDREISDNGVVTVTYSNGVKVYVNYTEADATVDGVAVKALSYEVR